MITAPEVLETVRLRLRRPILSDAEAISEYATDPQVTRYLSWHTHRSAGEASAFVEKCLKSWGSGQDLCWAMTIKPTDRVVGTVDCRVQPPAATVGFVLARPFWNLGYMTEAVRAVLAWASQLPGVYTVGAFCDIENIASTRVMEKAGMSREGFHRRYAVHPNISLEPRDCYSYAKVRGAA